MADLDATTRKSKRTAAPAAHQCKYRRGEGNRQFPGLARISAVNGFVTYCHIQHLRAAIAL
ncbi:hypothetical protein Q8F57_035375 [Paraburkholderia terrae]|uniref:hypothetical protein n=1 Tax=Paraburkholderia terrae TaxID=311230 RepID=UPI00296AA2AB|nr:hypothetical protein [Paraburkholderia terrae]MDW3659590.1 hypothetical protein [Paraburkholderia terrae]